MLKKLKLPGRFLLDYRSFVLHNSLLGNLFFRALAGLSIVVCGYLVVETEGVIVLS